MGTTNSPPVPTPQSDVPSVVAKLTATAIASINEPSGSMANNGVFTRGTALGTTYGNAWSFFPAGAIFTGSAAGWYFTQSTSTTAGTVFNNSYASGPLTIPGVLIPFVTTGPGAYTGVTTVVVGPQITLVGNTLGITSALRYAATWSYPNNANSKTAGVSLGGSSLFASAFTTTGAVTITRTLRSRGVTNAQVSDGGTGFAGVGTSAGAPSYTTLDMTQAQVLSLTTQLAVATDYMVLEGFGIEVLP